MAELEKGPRGLRRGRGARERILSASQQLFRDQGINRTGIDQICAVAEVSKHTLYQHFSGKDELIAECLRRFDPNVLPEVFERTDLPPRERLLAVFDIHSPLCPFIAAAVEIPDAGHSARALRPRLQEGLCRTAHRYLPRGWRRQPRTARRATGAAVGWRLGPRPSPQHRNLRDRRRHRGRPRRQSHPHGSGTVWRKRCRAARPRSRNWDPHCPAPRLPAEESSGRQCGIDATTANVRALSANGPGHAAGLTHSNPRVPSCRSPRLHPTND